MTCGRLARNGGKTAARRRPDRWFLGACETCQVVDLFQPVPGDGDWRNNVVLPDGENDNMAALGFAAAGEAVVDQWVAGGRNDLLFLPIVYLYRHAMELILKAGILQAAELLVVDGATDPRLSEPAVRKWLAEKAGHRLASLAARLDELLAQLDLEALPSATHDVLNAIHQLDPKGDTFRYTTTRDPATKSYVATPRPGVTHVDVVALRQHFQDAFSVLSGGVMSVLEEYRELQADAQAQADPEQPAGDAGA